jgi:lsr operon transcriptional repressor
LTVSSRSEATADLLLRVAWFYYKDELTQDEIARRLSVSRASVGRMLDRARKVGLVSISLNADHLSAFEVSRQLRQTFGLAEALVIPDHETSASDDQHGLNARLGLGGAQFMSTHLRPGGTLGVGWGETVSRVIASTNFGAVGPIHMVSLTGGVDAYLPAFLSSKADPEGATGEMTSATVIPTPIVASTPELATALKAEPAIQQVLKQACDVDQAIVGVGTPTADATIVQMGYLEAEDVRALRGQQVVGDILGQFFDASGRVVKLPIHDRRIGIELADLAKVDRVVGVAGGVHKVEAILGALRGGFLDVLVTNELTALRLLELEGIAGEG